MENRNRRHLDGGERLLEPYVIIPLVLIPPTAFKWAMVSSFAGKWIVLAGGVFFLALYFTYCRHRRNNQQRNQ